ncbi:MAG: DUF4258 domain-containing protein [Methylobacterium frigidaeris]
MPRIDNTGRRPAALHDVVVLPHAARMLETRHITPDALMTALERGSVRTDSLSGRDVIRDGDLRVVVERQGDRIVVVTAMHADDLAG